MNAAEVNPTEPGEGTGESAGPVDRRRLSTSPPRMTPLRELQLVDDYRAGDPEALGELLSSYQRRVYAVCYRMVGNVDEAADLAQDAMLKVIEGLDSYDGRARLSTWIIRVTINSCLSHLRKQKIRRHGSLDDTAGDEQVPLAGRIASERELSGPEHVEQAEARTVLLRVLGDIEPEMRGILVLRDMQDLDYQQIAEVLQVPVGTVKSRLFRARLALREAAEKALGESDSPRQG
ncbi:MAG: sigma-70 family RNA polymerase sigma factor [Phycisphaerales bacterium]|nr:MAG: sigma-70 family RNA polymerase sigma factor [Phycisphaerales bacterium]